MGVLCLIFVLWVVFSDLSNFTFILSRTFIEDLIWMPYDVNLVFTTLQSKMVCTVEVTTIEHAIVGIFISSINTTSERINSRKLYTFQHLNFYEQ